MPELDIENCFPDKTTIEPAKPDSRRWRLPFLTGTALALVIGLSFLNPGEAMADGGEFTVDPAKVVRTYLQCGGDNLISNHTVFVQQVKNPDGFNTADLGEISGQCGNRWLQPDNMVIPLSQVEYQWAKGRPVSIGNGKGVYYYSRTYPQCGGSVGAMDFKPNHTVLVNEFVEPLTDKKSYSWWDIGLQPGQCNNLP